MPSKKPQAAPNPAPAPGRTVLGLVALLLAIASSGGLVLQHFTQMTMPGCGPGSGCAALASSVWGSVPGLDLPVSFVGLAYFLGAAAVWLYLAARHRGLSPAFVWLVRFGAAASVLFLVVMISLQHFCLYCTLAHAGGLAFWLIVETTRRDPSVSRLQPVAAAAIVVVVAGGLLGADRLWAEKQEAKQEQDRQASVDDIIENQAQPPAEPFTGRYRIGPEVAAIRIVAFSDYQCPDCRRIEQQVRQIMAERDDVSFSHKHFPMSNKCNPHMGRSDPHPNACWAARAAEAAGILRGNEGFWEMHFLLFDREGEFTDAQLNGILRDLGYDVPEFLSIMQSQQTLDAVQEDIEEARSLGLHFTPLVFVNGVELKGFLAPNALVNTVNEVAATNPQPRTAEYDQPPRAAEKYVSDWREGFVRPMNGIDAGWTRGNPDGAARIVIWGDLSSSFTAQLQQEIMRLVNARGDVSYTFLHYPTNQSCNRSIERTLSATACIAAQAAEAAGLLGGAQSYWAMHDWILGHQNQLDMASLRSAAAQIGLDPDELQATMDSPEVADLIRAHVSAGTSSGVRRFIPAVYVNRRWVPRWRLEGHDILGAIVEEAAEE